jgi:hypothetical protein
MLLRMNIARQLEFPSRTTLSTKTILIFAATRFKIMFTMQTQFAKNTLRHVLSS